MFELTRIKKRLRILQRPRNYRIEYFPNMSILRVSNNDLGGSRKQSQIVAEKMIERDAPASNHNDATTHITSTRQLPIVLGIRERAILAAAASKAMMHNAILKLTSAALEPVGATPEPTSAVLELAGAVLASTSATWSSQTPARNPTGAVPGAYHR